jgi:transcription elongation factor GreA
VKLDPETRLLLEADRFEAVEDLWLARLEETPEDLEFFLPVLRALLQRQATARAELLLQLLLEARREQGGPESELGVLRRVLQIWPESPDVRAALVDCLRRRHGGSGNLERLVAHCGLADGKEPEKSLAQIESWLRFDIGQAVHSPAHGTGRVCEINLALSTVRADFQGQIVSFRLGEAERLLTPLPAGHFFLEKLEHLADLQRLAPDDPGEILHRAFASLGSPLALADLRTALDGIVPAEAWTAWWKRARADARLTVGPGTRPQCSWSETAAAAADQVAAEFAAASPRAQIEIARKHAGRSAELAQRLAQGLVALVHAARDSDPALALEALDALESLPFPEPAPVPVDAEAILRREDVAPILAGVNDRRARERAIDLLPKVRPDWPRVYATLLVSESDTRTLSRLYQALRDGPDPDALERAIQETLAQPGRAPRFYLWLCREMTSRPELEARADWRFLRRLLEACSTDALKGQRAALRELFDAGGIGLRVVARLDRDQSEQFLALLDHGAVLEEHRKGDLRQVIWTRHTELQEPKEEPIYVTAAALDRKRAEFDQITRVDIPRNTEEIRRAAAHGDLRENFEYKAARERQEMLSSRAKSMHDELRRARVLDPAGIDPSAIRVGTRVQLVPAADGGTPLALTILGPWDSDPSRGVISYMAPAVARLLGKGVGERVLFGEAEFTVGAIDVWQR